MVIAKNSFKTSMSKSKINLLTNKRLAKGRAVAVVADIDSKGASVSEFRRSF